MRMRELYKLKEAAEFAGTTPEALYQQVYLGRLKAYKINGRVYLDEDRLKTYCEKIFGKVGRPKITEEARAKKYERVLALFKDPCILSYGEIGSGFGLSRGRIHQLHDKFLPDEDRVEKRRLYRIQKENEKLFNDELFRTSYRILTHHFLPEAITPISFRTRAVMLKGKKTLLRKATKIKWPSKNCSIYHTYVPREQSDYVFYLLGRNNFLFIPKSELPPKQSMFSDSEGCKYYKFKNNFDSLLN